MADQTRIATGNSQPISQHPLFPAIVALWFGALFGLVSLAIPPALVESLVTLSGIDRFVPMAAPPLGSTARILVALGLTGLGGIVGALVARRISRPSPKAIERETIETAAQAPEAVSSVDAELQVEVPGAAQEASPPRLGRRRSLALSESNEPEPADIPAGAAPGGILDVSELDRDDEPSLTIGSLHDRAPMREIARGTFIAPSAQGACETPAIDVDADSEHEAAPSTPLGYRLFDSYAAEAAPKIGAAIAHDKASDIDAADMPVIGAEREPEDAAPGFELLDGPDQLAAPFAADPAAELDEPVTGSPAPWSAIHTTSVEAAAAYEPVVPPSNPSAAERLANADLDSLSSVELLERLALAMQRRRDAAAARPADMASNDTIADDGAVPAPKEFTTSEAERLARPTNFEGTSPAQAIVNIEAAPFARPVDMASEEPSSPTSPEAALGHDIAEPVRTVGQSDVAPWSRPAPFAPLTLVANGTIDRFVSQDGSSEIGQVSNGRNEQASVEDQATPESSVLSSGPFGSRALPAALRPVGFDDPIEEDALPGYVPPRHIGTAATLAPAPFAAPSHAPPSNAFGSETHAPDAHIDDVHIDYEDTVDEESEEDDMLDAGYSSLLNLSRQSPARQNFVRIEDPAPEDLDRAMVAFPGTDGPYADPGAQSAARPFDAPGRSSADDTERALRAALATLQRMSGAA